MRAGGEQASSFTARRAGRSRMAMQKVTIPVTVNAVRLRAASSVWRAVVLSSVGTRSAFAPENSPW
eukprot:957841-Pleurochrysis_carterae.AAC.1